MDKTLKESGESRQWAYFLRKLINLVEDHNQLSFCTVPLHTNFKSMQEICKRDLNKWK